MRLRAKLLLSIAIGIACLATHHASSTECDSLEKQYARLADHPSIQKAPDPGSYTFSDWRGRFYGTIDQLMNDEIFRHIQNENGKVALPAIQAVKVPGAWHNPDWRLVGRVPGKSSRSPLDNRFKGQNTMREFYWPTKEPPGDFSPTQVSAYNTRVAVNSVNGVEKEAEVFTYRDGEWHALLYERKEGKWIRKETDHQGKPVPEGCKSCHGRGSDFGPTPKLPHFARPSGWFKYQAEIVTHDGPKPAEIDVNYPKGGDYGEISRKVGDRLARA
jgi:hypothetical protein